MHVDWPFDVCARILPVLVFVTIHFMYGKQSNSVPFFVCVRGTKTFLHASFFSCIISVFERVVWEIQYVLEGKKYICFYEVQTPLHD
jgi:hypothetical protein